MSKTANYTLILMFTTVLSKLLGFLREFALAQVYGASAITDAYFVAFSIPTIIFSGIGSAILTGYISIYTDLKKNQPEKVKAFSDTVTTLVLFLSAVILGVFLLFDKQIVRLFAVGFKGDTMEKAVILSDIMIFSILFIGVYFVIQGFLQINGAFFAVGIVSVPLNLFIVLSVMVSSPETYKLLGWGVVLGYASSFLMLYFSAKRHRWNFSFNFHFNDKNIVRLLSLIFPIFLGKAVVQLNAMVDRTIASLLPAGSLTSLSYGDRILGFIISVFVLSVTTAVFPELSDYKASNDVGKIKKTVVSNCGIMSLLIFPISAGLMIFAKPIVMILFYRGRFTMLDVARTGEVLFFYAFGLLAFSIKDVMMNVFYALEDTKTPMRNSLLSLLINTVLNLILVKPMGHCGLALATSISNFASLVFLVISLRRKIGPLGLTALSKSLIKMFAATVIMSVCVIPAYTLFMSITGQSIFLSFMLSVIVGAFVYGAVNLVLKTKEMGMIVRGAYDRTIGRLKK